MAFEETIIFFRIKQFLLGLVTTVLLVLFGASSAFGLGLGELKLRSFLGQSLQAQLELVGSETEFFNSSCVRARVVTFDGAFIASVHVSMQQTNNRRHLLLTTRQHINEPAVNLIVDMNCEMQLHREFSILLDPSESSANSDLQLEKLPVASETNSLTAVTKLDAKTEALSHRQSSPKRLAARPQVDALPLEIVHESPKKTKRQKDNVVKDVLRLSDEVDLPRTEQGLRMSDVLSSTSGRELLENMQELRAAQARMAAILSDETVTKPLSSVDLRDLGEINQLKKEAEQLKKQNQIDRASLQQLQSKSSFDFWLLALSIIATLAILVIVFLLFYIRKNFGIAKPSWWEDDEDEQNEQASSSPVKIEEVIDQLQSKYEIDTGANLGAGTSKSESATPATGVPLSSGLVRDNGEHRTPTLEETNSSIFNFYTPRATSVKVEEISDVTQEAEFWISMNDPQRAIEILSAQERVEHPESPVPWLFLLDLYRTVGDRDKYEQLRQRFISFFNASIPEYDTELSTLPSRQLEEFPHILEKICAVWGGAQALPYLEGLLIDDRNGSRGGFDLPVYRDILMLIGIAREVERLRLADVKLATPDAPIELKQTPDPVDEAEFGTIDFEMIEFPLTDPDTKKNT